MLLEFNVYANPMSQSYSQWGEEGIIEKIFEIINPSRFTCCEFGAADGLFCSNTAALWKAGWEAYLFESDESKFKELKQNVKRQSGVYVDNILVDDIDKLIEEPIQLMSIDVDGLDLEIFRKIKTNHDVVVIEHNPTFPPWVYFEGGDKAGASIRSIADEATKKDYFFLTATKSNTFLVSNRFKELFDEYNTNILDNFDYSCLNYIVTDYVGNYDIIGLLPYSMERKVDFEFST